MGEFTNPGDQNYYWNNDQPPNNDPQMFYQQEYQQFDQQNLEFSPLGEFEGQAYVPGPQIYNPGLYDQTDVVGGGEFDEPPLLEELEIYPDRILEKIVAVSNPFRAHGLADDSEYLTKDSDLAGPVFFCIVFAACLFVSGNKAHFGYIYGISLISCILMYFLLSLMTPNSGVFTLFTVASVLGYCLIPIVGLSIIGIFLKLNGLIGIIVSAFCVIWSSISASRLFIAISGDKEQQPLIGYPCALVYGVYVLLVMF